MMTKFVFEVEVDFSRVPYDAMLNGLFQHFFKNRGIIVKSFSLRHLKARITVYDMKIKKNLNRYHRFVMVKRLLKRVANRRSSSQLGCD